MLGLALNFHRALQQLFYLVTDQREVSARAVQEELIQRAKQGDPEAWDTIFNRYYPEIYAYFRYRTASEEDAEDLAATVFERAVRHIRSYKEQGRGLGAWLQRIASNLLVDYYRRRNVNTRRTEPLSPTLADDGMSPVEHALRQDMADQVREMLKHLTEEQREVIVLRFLLGYSLAETAKVMNRKVNAVKALQHRALQRLRTVWGENRP